MACRPPRGPPGRAPRGRDGRRAPTGPGSGRHPGRRRSPPRSARPRLRPARSRAAPGGPSRSARHRARPAPRRSPRTRRRGQLVRRHDGRPGVAGLPVGGGEQVQPRAARRRARAISPPTPSTSSSGWAAQTSTVRQAGSGTRSGQGCSGSQRRHAASGVPGATDGPPGAGWGAGSREQLAEGGEVALAVVLAHVDGEVGDPLRRARRRARAVRRPAPGPPSRGRRPPSGPPARARAAPAAGRPAGRPERRRPPGPRRAARPAACRATSTAPRAAARSGSGSAAPQPGRDRAGAAGPDRGHPDAAVPEAGPLDVGTGAADGHGRDGVEVHVGRVAARPCPVRPRRRDRPARRRGSGRRGTAAGRRRRVAVTSAWVSVRAPEHQALRPSRRQPPSTRRAPSRAAGGSAAHTPSRCPAAGGGPSSSARTATASACPSARRASGRSAAPRAARASQRCAVAP